MYFKACISHMHHFTDKLYKSTSWNRLFKVDTVAAYRNYTLSAKTGSGNKCNFIHKLHGCSSKKRIVMVCCVREYRFENTSFRMIYSIFYCHIYVVNYLIKRILGNA